MCEARESLFCYVEIIGGLAQLVERLLCKQDVSGSSPLTSTDQPLTRKQSDG